MGSAMPTRNVVTTAPSRSSTKVAQTVASAQRCSQRAAVPGEPETTAGAAHEVSGPSPARPLTSCAAPPWSPSVGQEPQPLLNVALMVAALRTGKLARSGCLSLRQIVLFHVDRAVLVRPAEHDWRRLEVAVRRRRWSTP